MNSNATVIALGAIVVVLALAYAAGFGGSMAEQNQRRVCMEALSTPGVDDPAYDEKSIEFAEGLERCMGQ